MTWVACVVTILMLFGLVGSAVPVLPGTPLIVAGALVYAVATDFTPIGIGRLVVLGVLAVAGAVLAHLASALGVRGAGGGRRGGEGLGDGRGAGWRDPGPGGGARRATARATTRSDRGGAGAD